MLVNSWYILTVSLRFDLISSMRISALILSSTLFAFAADDNDNNNNNNNNNDNNNHHDDDFTF